MWLVGKLATDANNKLSPTMQLCVLNNGNRKEAIYGCDTIGLYNEILLYSEPLCV